ncbi:MAG: restriction endonuclease subunit S [Spirochaetaceae bacterium]|nr:restriction endonuclease subunit S [Spirochaetaceae bacterium]
MEEWKECKLEEICTKITDGSHFSPQACQTGYPMFSVKDMHEYGFDYSNCKHISAKDFESMKNGDCVPQKGDILVAKDGSFLKQIFECKETKEEAILSSIAMFRPNQDFITPTFLCYLLKSPKVYNYIASNCVSGSALPRIVLKDFKKVSMQVPPLPTQQKIAAILSSLDDKIELNNKINTNLEQQAGALFKNWFVDFEPFGGKMPEGWKVGKLSDLIAVKYGKDHKKLNDGNYPVYGSGGIMRYVEKFLYDKESVLIPRKGTLNNVFYINEPFWSVDTIFYTEMKKENIAKYVYFFVKGKDLNSMNAGSAVPSMTTEILNAIEVVIPSDEYLEKFENIVSPMFKQIKQCIIENENLTCIRDTLLPKLMNGEIEVEGIVL